MLMCLALYVLSHSVLYHDVSQNVHNTECNKTYCCTV